jgi:predicted DCC family thiol-disulfide oxidoreductase YuxK
MAKVENAPPSGWVLFDGSCGVCSRLALRWTPTLRRLGFETEPLQSPWVVDRLGLPEDVLINDIRLLHPDGSLTSGPDVYRFVMKRLWWAYPFYLLTRLPILSSVFNWGYRAFARHRFRISKSCMR